MLLDREGFIHQNSNHVVASSWNNGFCYTEGHEDRIATHNFMIIEEGFTEDHLGCEECYQAFLVALNKKFDDIINEVPVEPDDYSTTFVCERCDQVFPYFEKSDQPGKVKSNFVNYRDPEDRSLLGLCHCCADRARSEYMKYIDDDY